MTGNAGRYIVTPHFSRWAVRDLGNYDADAPLFNHRWEADEAARRKNDNNAAAFNPTPTLFDKDEPMTQPLLRGPADADHYRVKVGRYGDRWYTDPLPGCDIAPAVTEGADTWPSVSAIKNANSTDWTYVGLKRVALALGEKPNRLDGLGYEELYDALKAINRLGLKQAQDRGTNVHTYLECGLRGQPVKEWLPGEPGADYLPAVRSFLDTYQPEMVAAEVVCINRDLNGVGYGGTSDGLIRIDGKTYWVDWKSRGADSDHGAYAEEAAQLGAYARAQYMLVEGPNGPQRQRLPKADGGLIVSVKPDGVRIYPIDLDKAVAYFTKLHGWWIDKKDGTAAIGKAWAPRAHPAAPDFAGLASIAGSVEDLMALHGQAVAAGQWNEAVKAAFSARKAHLTQVAA